ncbi:MAG: hypothetical protein HC944_02630 [Nanoarchaeota archaeon]|nr:hypothetical protein [Nanoarchaeota archaeon]
MEEIDEIKELINKINMRDLNSKDYQKMKIEELSANLREVMKFQQDTFQSIDEFEKAGIQQDLLKYAKMICNNTTDREILKIQEVYLNKIDEEYLK